MAAVSSPSGTPIELEVAVRAWATPDKKPRPRRGAARVDQGPSGWTLVFDTETTTDPGQGLRIGCYQLLRGGRLREEGLFHEPASLTPSELELVRTYSAAHGLRLLTRDDFAEDVFLKTAWDRRGLIVGHSAASRRAPKMRETTASPMSSTLSSRR